MSWHLDDAVGGALERTVTRHHRKRLARLGHGDVFAAPAASTGLWAGGPRSARTGNSIDVLIDGNDALGAMADALEAATSHVHLAGWHLTPEFALRRHDGAPTLQQMLGDLADRVDVRVLLWAGPPLPLFAPTRSTMHRVRDQLIDGTRVECVLDARERTLHCHHEKILVVDDAVAFVGGIDLSDLAGDRWDHRDHPPRGATGWHDVATRIAGPIVTDVAQHFRDRWQDVTGSAIPAPLPQPPAGDVELQLVRTVPEGTYRFAPHGEFSILDGYLRALHSAAQFIYLENQFLWSAEIVDVLTDKLQHPPSEDFRIVLVLPARPSNGADTTRGQLGRLLEADDGAGRVLATTVHAHAGELTEALYVHAKVGIVDDRWLTIGSANLNEHSLFNDTEVNVLTLDPELARTTRLRLWSEHLELPVGSVDGPPVSVIDGIWKPVAERELRLSQQGAPAQHRLTRLAAVSRRTERLFGPARGLLVDG